MMDKKEEDLFFQSLPEAADDDVRPLLRLEDPRNPASILPSAPSSRTCQDRAGVSQSYCKDPLLRGSTLMKLEEDMNIMQLGPADGQTRHIQRAIS